MCWQRRKSWTEFAGPANNIHNPSTFASRVEACGIIILVAEIFRTGASGKQLLTYLTHELSPVAAL